MASSSSSACRSSKLPHNSMINPFSAQLDERMEREIISINVDAVTFSLHRFPLLASSGKLRRMAEDLEVKNLGYYQPPMASFNSASSSSSSSSSSSEEEEEEETAHANYSSINKHRHSRNVGGGAPSSASDSMAELKLKGFPGGADAFELTVKSCYGINVDITARNVAPLLCAADYLELDTLFSSITSYNGSAPDSDSLGTHTPSSHYSSRDHMQKFPLYSGINLVSRCHAFLDEIVSSGSVERCVDVLHSCIPILREAEKLEIVNRCIEAIVSSVCKLESSSPKVSSGHHHHHHHPVVLRRSITFTPPFNAPNMTPSHASTITTNHIAPINPHLATDRYRVHLSNYGLGCTSVVEHWARHISMLRIDLFQRVMGALKSRGVEKEMLGGALIHYAEENLMKPLMERGGLSYVLVDDHIIQGRGIMINKPKVKGPVTHLDGVNNMVMGNNKYGTHKAIEHEQRVLAETLVHMLPKDNGLFHTGFLLGLLRASIVLDTTVACRMDLECRVGMHLESASVNEFLVPILSHTSSDSTSHGAVANVYDVDLMQRIVSAYLRKRDEMGGHIRLESSSGIFSEVEKNHEDSGSGGIRKVAKLIDQYLAEISTDAHLPSSKFISLAELLPDYARSAHDGLYRAIDMYLKAHPMLPDMERKRMCKLLDCQKLSQEACAHAAQNERLPVQMVVQVLYFEQLRMRNTMAATTTHESEVTLTEDIGANMSGQSALNRSPQHRTMDIEPYSSLKRENRELKLHAERLQVRVKELETENISLKEQLANKGGRTNLVGPTTARRGSASGGEGFFSQFTRRLGRMHIFSSSSHSSPKARMASGGPKQSRSRRHSIS